MQHALIMAQVSQALADGGLLGFSAQQVANHHAMGSGWACMDSGLQQHRATGLSCALGHCEERGLRLPPHPHLSTHTLTACTHTNCLCCTAHRP